MLRYLSEAESGKINVAEKVRDLWKAKKGDVDILLAVFEHAQKSTDELDDNAKVKRADYFNLAKVAWETGLPKVLSKLNEELIGPFALGTSIQVALNSSSGS